MLEIKRKERSTIKDSKTNDTITSTSGEIKRDLSHKWTSFQHTMYSALRAYNSTQASEYAPTYASFSGHDMVVIFEIPIPNGPSISQVIGSLQTVTYSIHDEKYPIRGIGDMNAKGYVFGPRTIAGTMIFTVFNRHWARNMMDKYLAVLGKRAHFLTDELPPMNVTVSMANEYGQRARLAIFGVTFVNEGQVMSINDNYTENTFQFYATDVDYLDSEDDTEEEKIEKKKRITRRQLNRNIMNMLPDSIRSFKPITNLIKELTDSTADSIVDRYGLKKIADPLDLQPYMDKMKESSPILGEIAEALVDPKKLKKYDRAIQEYARLHPYPEKPVEEDKEKHSLFNTLKTAKDAAKAVISTEEDAEDDLKSRGGS